MNILMIHNRYLQAGGEDKVFDLELGNMSRFHNMFTYITESSSLSKNQFSNAVNSIWNERERKSISEMIELHDIDIVHMHNTFPVLSPSIFLQTNRDVRIIQTLHNYRPMCIKGTLFRDGSVCEDCLIFGRLHGIKNRCYRQGFKSSIAATISSCAHEIISKRDKVVDTNIVLSAFSYNKYVEWGMDPKKMAIKPNFVIDRGVGSGNGNYYLFVGRISEEKGILELCRAWQEINTGARLLVIGTGPLETEIIGKGWQNIEFLGHKSESEVGYYISGAISLIISSIWYEGFPMVVLEAISRGTPVIASDIGSLSSIVRNGIEGYRYDPRSPASLKDALEKLSCDFNIRASARKSYELHYTPEKNSDIMNEIYRRAMHGDR